MGRKKKRKTFRGKGYPVELKVKIAREVVDKGRTIYEVATTLGLPPSSVKEWALRYEARGAEGLERFRSTPVEDETEAPTKDPIREAVERAKAEQPDAGTRKIRDLLARFEGIGVSETQVRRVLHDAGLLSTSPPRRAQDEKPPRRFERARPMQMWQSDIYTFLLRKHQRLYLVGFMDDHSRFLVSHVVAHHQKSELVMEALERGIAEYGAPEEMLTDNGRQYTAWRGETAFEAALKQHGIKHIKSRPQHPMTLGKIERFWKTLWDEFLSRTIFDDFADCEKRLALFVQAYNFQRPHQGLDGLVPADRFFHSAPQVREAVQKNVVDNAFRLAHEIDPSWWTPFDAK